MRNNRIWFFGCSFTEGAGLKYDTYEGYSDPSREHFTEIVARRLGYHLENKATGGSSNESIFLSLSHETQYIENKDICVLGLTHPNRQPIFYKTQTNKSKMTQVGDHWEEWERFQRVPAREKKYMDKTEIAKGVTHRSIFDNTTSYIKMVKRHQTDEWNDFYNQMGNSLLKLLSQRGVKTLIWDYTEWVKYPSIKEDTKDSENPIDDYHWSWKGSDLFANELIRRLKKEYKDLKNDLI